MAQTPQLLEFAAAHGLKMITIDDLAQYIRRRGDGSNGAQ